MESPTTGHCRALDGDAALAPLAPDCVFVCTTPVLASFLVHEGRWVPSLIIPIANCTIAGDAMDYPEPWTRQNVASEGLSSALLQEQSVSFS